MTCSMQSLPATGGTRVSRDDVRSADESACTEEVGAGELSTSSQFSD
jgi:hypothetical protein